MDTLKGIWSVGMGMVQAPTELQSEQDSLQTKLLSAHSLISRSEWAMFKSMDLDALLVKLKYATYNAEDLLREYKDRELRQNVEDAARSRAGQVFSSSLNIVKHVIFDSSKRVKDTQDKLDKVMAEVKEVLSSMGLDRVEPVQLMPTTTEIITASQVYGRDTERDQLMKMLGVTVTIDREDEFNQVITQLGMPLTVTCNKGKSKAATGHGTLASTHKSAKRLKGNRGSSTRLAETTTNSTSQVSVLPIFGIGGMGKTTLAQLIYNNEMVKAHFTDRIWVCVSDLFDIKRMTKEIVKTISDPNFGLSTISDPNFALPSTSKKKTNFGLSGLTDLQEEMSHSRKKNPDLQAKIGGCPIRERKKIDPQAELKEQLKSKKFFLVLDDIWQITQQQWESFYAYLKDGLEGSMILVTTRHENIAQLVATSNCEPVQLKGLPDDTFWEFFKKCAFGRAHPESYPRLQEIGRRISYKLHGTPLAAKTLGRLLNSNLTEEHWDTIDNSELWEQKQQEGEILPALRLSYLYLPPELRRCFAFCSMFPKDYSFEKHKIVDIWVAEGFVAPQGNMHVEDIGISYLDELRGRCLFQTDPNFPNHNRYVMHDLIHDTAQHASMHECLLMTDSSYLGRYEFRHMSVEVDAKSLSTMKNIQLLNRLRSLRFGQILDAEITWFSQLSNILFLSLKGCRLEKLPESICELSSLRYIDMSNSSIKELPGRFWFLYNLQVVDADQSHIETIHDDVTNLINLRRLALPYKASIVLSKLPGLGNLSCLRNLSYFTVRNLKHNVGIGELKGMNQLRGKLCIRCINSLKSKEEAAAARLVDKNYLKELELNWRNNLTSCKLNPIENEVIDGLCPNERIEHLGVHGFAGDRLPSWFNPIDLPNLRSVELSSCPWFETLSIPFCSTGGTQQGSSTSRQHANRSTNCSNDISSLGFTHVTRIRIARCNGLKNLDQFLSPKTLPSVESNFVGFVHLRDLDLNCCSSLMCPQSREMVFPHSLQRLHINRCGELDRSFPSCLEKLASLTVLYLENCDNVVSIPLDSIPCRNTLKLLRLDNCPKLSSIGESGVPSSIKYVKVSKCAKLTQVSQPYLKNALSIEEEDEIREFVGTCWYIL